MTLTEEKRKAYGSAFIRKDARNAIYTVLYGKQEHYNKHGFKRSNEPEYDITRRLGTFWDWELAKATWDRLVELAAFEPKRRAVLEARLESLKHHRAGA